MIYDQKLSKLIKSRKGSAAVLTLSVIIVLTALGMIALLATLSNIKMGDKFRNWSKAYYSLDAEAEQNAKKVDDRLKQAEEAARDYIINEYFLAPSLPADVANVQKYPGTNNNLLNGYASAFFQANWWDDTLEQYLADNTGANEQDYQHELQSRSKDFFNKLYFFYAEELLADLDADLSEPEISIISLPADFNKYASIKTSNPPEWDACNPSPTDLGLSIVQSNGVSDDPKSVRVELYVKLPDYETAIQTIYKPIKLNPLASNALTASGGINFEGDNTTIDGDLFSSDPRRAGSYAPDEQYGIQIKGSNIDVNGNVYSNGDLHVTESNGSLHVDSGASIPHTGKKGMYNISGDSYGSSYFFNIGIISTDPVEVKNYAENYIEPKPPLPPTLLFYKDDGSGNIYCNNLSVEENVSNGGIDIDGNIWTNDDIEMDGFNSHITVGGNYIGISNEASATTGDPNASSSIINNTAFKADGSSSSTITLNGHMIIPGTAFLEFDDNKYYQTAESVSAKTWDIFNAYTYTGTNPEITGYEKYSKDDTNVYLNDVSFPYNIAKFVDYIKGTGGFTGSHNIKTNIRGSGEINGYSPGLTLIQKSGDSEASMYYTGSETNTVAFSRYSDNQTFFKQAVGAAHNGSRNALQMIYDLKTQNFGVIGRTFDTLHNSMSDTTDNGFIYNNGSTTITIGDGPGAIGRGIIYVQGNLTLEGEDADTTNEFQGTIICDGNVTVGGNIKLVYDEGKIKGVMENNVKAQTFFKSEPDMGEDFAFAKDYSTTSGSRPVTLVKRYRVDKWLEISGRDDIYP